MNEGGWIRRWAGLDTGGDQHKFKDAGVDGVLGIGMCYQGLKNYTIQGWHYDFLKQYSSQYLDVKYSASETLDLAFQAGYYNEKNSSNIDGHYYGLRVNYKISPIALLFAYNQATNDSGKYVDGGLGVGNFFTSMDDTTISGKTDASAYKLGIDYAFTDKLNIGIFYGHFEDENKATVDIDEFNVKIAWQIARSLDLEYIRAEIDNSVDPSDTSTNITRDLLRINYRF